MTHTPIHHSTPKPTLGADSWVLMTSLTWPLAGFHVCGTTACVSRAAAMRLFVRDVGGQTLSLEADGQAWGGFRGQMRVFNGVYQGIFLNYFFGGGP